jgi:hypothetical protein
MNVNRRYDFEKAKAQRKEFSFKPEDITDSMIKIKDRIDS